MPMEEVYPELGALIRERRKQLQLTQLKLARQLDISRASLANIETGRQRILVHQLYEFADALDLAVEDLLPGPQKDDSRDTAGLPFPPGLSPKQRAQIARLLGAPESEQESKSKSEQ